MSLEIPKCRITVLKRTVHKDLMEEFLEKEYRDRGPCECFTEGEEFVIDPSVLPEDFCARCPWAWADIRHEILIAATGCVMPGIKQSGTVIAGCRDWFRPVIFKVERLEDD